MTSLDVTARHGAAYYPSILKEQEGMKKFAQAALVDRLLKFNIFPNDSAYVTRSTTGQCTTSLASKIYERPSGRISVSSFVKQFLDQLVKIPTGYALYDFIGNSDARIDVYGGNATFAAHYNGVNKIVLSLEGLEGYATKVDIRSAISQKPTGEICLFKFPLIIDFAHECNHVRHRSQGVNILQVKYPHDLYFSNAEEMLTITGSANCGTQRVQDPICDRAISRELGFPVRVSHNMYPLSPPSCAPALLGVDEEIQKLIAEGRHREKNYLLYAIDGASRKNQSFQGNQLKVIQMLLAAGCQLAHIYESIEYLLSDPSTTPKFKAKILKMFGPKIFHEMIRFKPLTFDYSRWIRAINAAEGAQAVKALLQSKVDGLTPLQVARKVGAEKLVSYLEDLEKESRYRYPVFDRQ